MHRFLTNYTPPQKKQKKTSEQVHEQKRKYEKQVRQRGFLPKWKHEFVWLAHSDSQGMTCVVCIGEGEKNGPFIHGCKNYKKDTIQAHEKSLGHEMNVKKRNAKIDPSSTQAAKTIRSLNKLTMSQLTLKFKSVHGVCRMGRPFTDYVRICEMDEAKGLNVGTQYRSDKSAAEFMHFIAEAQRLSIKNTLSNAKYVSAISDGTTDCSFQEAEIVYIRHCHEGKIGVNFSLVKNTSRGDAESIAGIIIAGLKNLVGEQYGRKIVGLGTDGASVMTGNVSGAVQRIRVATGRSWLVGVHCAGHKIELAYKDMVKEKILLYTKIDTFLLNIYYFYRNSNLTRAGLKESFKSLGEAIILPTRAGGTRWIKHLKLALDTYLRGFAAIRQHMGQLSNPDDRVGRSIKGNKAKNFFKICNSKDVWLMMHFLQDCLSILNSISVKFQLRTASIAEILVEVEIGVKSLEKLKLSDGPNLRKGLVNEPAGLKGTDVSFKSARRKFLDAILTALKKRFTDNPGILASTGVANLTLFPLTREEAQDYGDADIAALVDYFKAALQEAEVDADLCEPEWTKLKYHIFSRCPKPNRLSWEEINEKLKEVCPNILSLIDIILTLPASSAEAERGFNRLKFTKSDWRSRLSDCKLTDQMVIMLESPGILEYDPLTAIHLWNETPRRVRSKKEIVQPVALPTVEAEPAQAETAQVEPVEAEPAQAAEAEHANAAAEPAMPGIAMQAAVTADSSDSESGDEDYFSDSAYEEEDLEEDEVVPTRNDRINEAQNAYARLCDML